MELNWINRIPGYHYYDTPDGEDCLKKLAFVNKMGLYFGAVAGTVDCILISKPVGFWNILGRYGICTGPVLAVFSSWAAATCLSTNFRGKNDGVNYFYGGLAAGSVIGAVVKNGSVGCAAGVLIGIIGHASKEAEKAGLTLFSDTSKHEPNFGGPWLKHYNFSMWEDKPRGWKKFEDEKLEA